MQNILGGHCTFTMGPTLKSIKKNIYNGCRLHLVAVVNAVYYKTIDFLEISLFVPLQSCLISMGPYNILYYFGKIDEKLCYIEKKIQTSNKT